MGRDLIHFFFMLVVFSLELRLSWYFHQSVVTHIATSALALHITCPFFPFFCFLQFDLLKSTWRVPKSRVSLVFLICCSASSNMVAWALEWKLGWKGEWKWDHLNFTLTVCLTKRQLRFQNSLSKECFSRTASTFLPTVQVTSLCCCWYFCFLSLLCTLWSLCFVPLSLFVCFLVFLAAETPFSS